MKPQKHLVLMKIIIFTIVSSHRHTYQNYEGSQQNLSIFLEIKVILKIKV